MADLCSGGCMVTAAAAAAIVEGGAGMWVAVGGVGLTILGTVNAAVLTGVDVAELACDEEAEAEAEAEAETEEAGTGNAKGDGIMPIRLLCG